MKPVPHIAALAPYALANLAPGLTSLAQNESLRPPSPKALEAARNALSETHLYPDPDWTDLRTVISDVHYITCGTILCGAGSMELIGALASAYLLAGDRMLTTGFAYLYFRTATQLSGAAFDLAPETDFTVDVDALIDAVRPETKILFVANPGNPTGTRIGLAELRHLRSALPDNVMLVIDEAYGEFADGLDDSSFDLVEQGNTAVLRTFSKAYGCAGMRVGWGVFPPKIATEMRKILNPNNVSGVSQAAAVAAMRDQDYMRETVRRTACIRDRFADRMRATSLHIPKSHTNFVTLAFDSAGVALAADDALRSDGIAMRSMSGYGLAQCLRATIAKESVMDRAAQCLERFMGGWK